MDDFDAGILQDPAHDIGRGIMTVEKGGGGDYSDNIFRSVNFNIRVHKISPSSVQQSDRENNLRMPFFNCSKQYLAALAIKDSIPDIPGMIVFCDLLQTEADTGNLE
jgi:hypothetical protein